MFTESFHFFFLFFITVINHFYTCTYTYIWFDTMEIQFDTIDLLNTRN